MAEPQNKDLESGKQNTTEQINYLREVLFLMSIQMGIYALACGLNAMNKSYNQFFASFLVLILASVIFVGTGYVLHTMEEYRKKEIWKYVLLGAGTAGFAMFVASLAAIFSVEIFFVMVFGGFMGVTSCYVTSRYIESTKVRDDV